MPCLGNCFSRRIPLLFPIFYGFLIMALKFVEIYLQGKLDIKKEYVLWILCLQKPEWHDYFIT